MSAAFANPQTDVASLLTDPVRANAPYGVIAGDPPWGFRNNGLADSGRSSATRYGELTLAELKSLGSAVKLLAKPDSVLLLWAVPSMVPEAIEVTAAWGFSYVTMVPWFKLTSSSVHDLSAHIRQFAADLHDPDIMEQSLQAFENHGNEGSDSYWDALADLPGSILRPSYGMGWWARGCFEPLIIAKRGNPRGVEGYRNGNFVGLLSENFGHSRKPDNIYQLGEQFAGPRLELFARRQWPNWVATGLDIDGRDVRDLLHDPQHLSAAAAD